MTNACGRSSLTAINSPLECFKTLIDMLVILFYDVIKSMKLILFIPTKCPVLSPLVSPKCIFIILDFLCISLPFLLYPHCYPSVMIIKSIRCFQKYFH